MSSTPSSIKAYIVPFAAYMALMAVANLFPLSERFWMYPSQTIICGALLIWYWAVYKLKAPQGTIFTLITAVLMLIIWISPQLVFRLPWRFIGFDPTAFKATPAFYYAAVTIRFIRLAVIVPFIEEIFWRSFLLRYLVSDDFESVPPGTYTWLSFWVVTAGFCMEHKFPDWPAAILAGALFNLIYYRTRSLSSCVLAHAVANFLLGIYIMRTGQWGFW
jgi:uncharacterized protein